MNRRKSRVVLMLAMVLIVGMATGVSPAYAASTSSRLKTLEKSVKTLKSQLASIYSRLTGLEARAPIPGPQGPTGATGPTGAQGPKGDPGTPADTTEIEALRREVSALNARIESLEQTAAALQTWRAGMPKRIASGIVTSTADVQRTVFTVPDATGAEIVQVTQLGTHNGIWHYADWSGGTWCVNSGSNITARPVSVPVRFMWVAIYP